ncbi:helix-turn-helix domain-containing protein [Caldicellulosiruptor acetigenus]|uniref:helix-turn-helix domain-containing protein n=1 Tax=Caldicellulosiruptor acetigenus TaxID=301953 RepID=UPI0038BA0B8E
MFKLNSKTIIRVSKRDCPYVIVDKTALNDNRLSWKAKGLLCYLLSLPDDWKINLRELTTHSSDGRDSTQSALNELIKFGYCVKERVRDEKGRFAGYMYTVYERPIGSNNAPEDKSKDGQPTFEQKESSNPEAKNLQINNSKVRNEANYETHHKDQNPCTEKPYTENPSLLNNDGTNYSVCVNNTTKEKQDLENKGYSELDNELISKLAKHEIAVDVIDRILHTTEGQKKNVLKVIESPYFQLKVLNKTAFLISCIQNNWSFDDLNNERVAIKNSCTSEKKTEKRQLREERDVSAYLEMEKLYKKVLWGEDAKEALKMQQKTGKSTAATGTTGMRKSQKPLHEERDPSIYLEMEKLYKEYLRNSSNDDVDEEEVFRFLGLNPA